MNRTCAVCNKPGAKHLYHLPRLGKPRDYICTDCLLAELRASNNDYTAWLVELAEKEG